MAASPALTPWCGQIDVVADLARDMLGGSTPWTLPPLIFITPSAFLPEYSRFLMEVGPALLVKPVSPAKLWASVERLLGPRRT